MESVRRDLRQHFPAPKIDSAPAADRSRPAFDNGHFVIACIVDQLNERLIRIDVL
jgi:hypothetical protein